MHCWLFEGGKMPETITATTDKTRRNPGYPALRGVLECRNPIRRGRSPARQVDGRRCIFAHQLNLPGSPMPRQHRANHLLHRLNELYPEAPIPLHHRDAYTLLVAVLLSAQCTDARVNRVTPALFDLADNPQDMRQVPVTDIQAIIRSCGLAPRKSAAIAQLSEILVERHGGEVPADFASLEALPGVGHKTASVVMAQAFGVPAFPVDTHIHRLAARWKLSTGKSVAQTERDLKSLFPRESWNRLHLQMLYYGREHCTARGCDGKRCLLCRELNAMPPSPAEMQKPKPPPMPR